MDKRFTVGNGRWHVGALAGAGEARRSFAEDGKGSTDSHQLGAYAAFTADDGFYVDTVIKANRFRHDFDLVGTDGAAIKGKYSNQGGGVSAQAGKPIALERGWFVEPQAELSWLRDGGSRYSLSNGMQVHARGGTPRPAHRRSLGHCQARAAQCDDQADRRSTPLSITVRLFDSSACSVLDGCC